MLSKFGTCYFITRDELEVLLQSSVISARQTKLKSNICYSAFCFRSTSGTGRSLFLSFLSVLSEVFG